MSPLSPKIDLGLIEGFYGKPWSWDERKDMASFLGKTGYSHYFYAPKSDPYLRRKWREPMPQELTDQLAALSKYCRAQGIDFGLGFTPYDLHFGFDQDAKTSLLERIRVFEEIGVDRLAILFDDMKGGLPGLAQIQADIVRWIRERSSAKRISMCPTYYSWDPILEKLFGERPPRYFEELGAALDPSVEVFWTGDLICSKTYESDGLERLSTSLGRKPLLWDNYPVNDGPKMCPFLHLRAATGRPSRLKDLTTGHVVNPMNQAALSKISMLTLKASYSKAENYDPKQAFVDAVASLGSLEFAKLLETDLEKFQDQGLEALSQMNVSEAQSRYARLTEAPNAWIASASAEILAWTRGEYRVTRFE